MIKGAAKNKAELVEPIKEMIEAERSFVYRTVAALLGMNKNTVQQIFQPKGWTCLGALSTSARELKRRFLALRGRINGPVQSPRRQGWLASVIDCGARQVLRWHPSRTCKASTASAAFEEVLIICYGILGWAPAPFLSRSENRFACTSHNCRQLTRGHGLRQVLKDHTARSSLAWWSEWFGHCRSSACTGIVSRAWCTPHK